MVHGKLENMETIATEQTAVFNLYIVISGS